MSATPTHDDPGRIPKEEVKPLVDLCRAGKLFEVQDWIKAGRPVNPPHTRRGNGPRSPLEVAIERGFHSLVRILLEGGASFDRRGCGSAMSRALRARRLDIVQLLVGHGYDPASVDMREVFETWDPEIMDYFIDRGANVEDGNPLAYALCNHVRTALRVLKRGQDRFQSFQRQADIALRYHCKAGNLKWISLMLWAGADPYSAGPDDPDREPSSEGGGYSALALAALHRHYEVFQLKQVRLDAKHPSMRVAAFWSCHREGLGLLKVLLEHGLEPNDQENGGCSLLHSVFVDMSWDFGGPCRGTRDESKGRDTRRAQDRIEVIELLVQHGARWVPADKDEINTVRRSLLKLVPRYTVAVFSSLARHKACPRGVMQALLGTPAMRKHLGTQAGLLTRFMPSFPDDPWPTPKPRP